MEVAADPIPAPKSDVPAWSLWLAIALLVIVGDLILAATGHHTLSQTLQRFFAKHVLWGVIFAIGWIALGIHLLRGF